VLVEEIHLDLILAEKRNFLSKPKNKINYFQFLTPPTYLVEGLCFN
jgi:hypothetical protein